jgi:hypothetical protein
MLPNEQLPKQSRKTDRQRPCVNPQNPECPENTSPLCNIVVNNDFRYELQRIGLAQDVAGPLQLVFQRHYSSYPGYDLPITFIWDSIGLQNIMAGPNPPLDCCNKDIHFTRAKEKFRMISQFTWSGQAFSVPSKPNPILQGFTISVKIPEKLSGIATVGAGFFELNFDDNKMPHLLIEDSRQQKVFDADLQCIKTSTTSVVLKPIEPSGTQINPDLLIHP